MIIKMLMIRNNDDCAQLKMIPPGHVWLSLHPGGAQEHHVKVKYQNSGENEKLEKVFSLGTSNFASMKHPIQNGVKTWWSIIPGVESTLLVLFSFQQFWSIILRASFMARVEEILEGKVRTFVISATPTPTPNTHTHLSGDYLQFFSEQSYNRTALEDGSRARRPWLGSKG